MASESKRFVDVRMEIRRFHLPPVESALLVGRRATIGPKAMAKALEEMMPGKYTSILLEHPVAEALLVRASYLRTIPKERLVELVLRQTDGIMDEGDMMHIDLDLVVQTSERLDL